MRRRAPSAALVAAAALAAACDRSYPNPFEDPALITTAVPPDGASLVFTTDGWTTTPGRGRELMAVATDGSLLTRLTFCDAEGRPCDTVEGDLASDNERAVVRRVLADSSGDGRLDDSDNASLVFVDLAAQAEAELLSADQQASGIDWAPASDLLVYSAQGPGGEDLFRTTPRRPTPDNAQETLDLTCPDAVGAQSCDTALGERRPRIDPAGTVAAFARIDGGEAAEVWVFQTTVNQTRVTTGTSGGGLLTGTPYREGSDTDPSYSPDGQEIVFRHLARATSDGRGVWEIRTVRRDGSGLRTLAVGEAWRGAPDWGPEGVVFPESDASGTRLVLIAPDGSSRAIVSYPAGTRLDHPRWLRR